MSWLKRDDQRCLHPKIGALTDREYRAFDALNEYCGRVRNQGIFHADDVRHAMYATPKGARSVTRRELARFVEHRLVDQLSTETQPSYDRDATETQPKPDLHKIHDWDQYQPKDPTGAARKRLERERNQTQRPETVTRQSPDNPRTSHAQVTPSRARVPVPSQKELKAVEVNGSEPDHDRTALDHFLETVELREMP